MSKVLQFFGIGKKPEGQGLQMLQSAQMQERTDVFGDGPNSSQKNVVTTKTTVTTSQVVSQTLPRERSNIMAPGNEAARQKFDTFSAQSKPALAAQTQQFYTNSDANIGFPVASNAPGVSASQSTRGLTALEVYSTPVRPIEYDEIKTKLTNFVERTFPSPFPSRLSNPDDFDNDLQSTPYPATHIDFLMENSKYSDKSKENQRNKFLNYKKEIEFCKRYINMNEVKKQKLLQEIEDYRRRHGGYNQGQPSDNEFRGLESRLREQDQLINQEKQDLEQLRQHLQSAGGDLREFGAVTPNVPYGTGQQEEYYESPNANPAPRTQFNANAFSKKVNAVNTYDNQQGYQPESDNHIDHQKAYGGNRGNQAYDSPQYQNDSQNWGGHGGYEAQSNHYITPQSQGNYRDSQFAFDDPQRQSHPRQEQHTQGAYGVQQYGGAFAEGNYGHYYNDPTLHRESNTDSYLNIPQKNNQQRTSQYAPASSVGYGQPQASQGHGQAQHYDYAQSHQTIQTTQGGQQQPMYGYNNDDFDPLAEHPQSNPNQYNTNVATAHRMAPQGQPKKNNPLMKKL
jgi:hypothetical protein